MIAIQKKLRYLGFFLIVSCTAFSIDQANSDQSALKPVWVNVFVHGIISIKPTTTLANFFRFINDDFEDSPYSLTINNIRHNSFFYQNQTIQALGLHPINSANCAPGAAACVMARIFDKVTKLNSGNPNDIDSLYYTYGWSAVLSRSARLEDATIFLNQLNSEIDRLRAQGFQPKVRLIGYSHGGTVILKLALAKRLYGIAPRFEVEQAYLLGTPIQGDTDYLITDPLFKKIYNIYSRGDRFQKLDMFSAGQFFSERKFMPHCTLPELPNKLTQIEIKLTRKPLGKGCCRNCNDADCCANVPSYKNRRNVSPGHSELWFFGWTPMHYRKTFPLYPLPVVTFLPYIIDAIDSYEPTHHPERSLVVTIDTSANQMNILDSADRCCKGINSPFLDSATLNALKQEALSYRPDPALYNWCKFDAQIEKETAKAFIQRKQKRCGR
ncbi:hypothetical protein BH09DEP1_BH09DEP1_2970 [soil metagenome]